MRCTRRVLYGLTVCLFFFVFHSIARSETLPADRTFDGQTFHWTRAVKQEEERYTVWRLTYPSPHVASFDDYPEVFAYLYIPRDWKRGDKPRTGIVCIDVLGGNGAITAFFGSHFASRGFPVFLPILPAIGERAPQRGSITAQLKKPGGIPALAELFQRVHPELRRGLDLFCSNPEVASDRVHVIGVSLGAIVTCGLAAKDKRVDRIAILLGGGNLKRIVELNSSDSKILAEAMQHASPKDLDLLHRSLKEIEPLAFASELKRKADANLIMMFNAENDEIVLPERSRELATAIGMESKRKVFPGVGHFTSLSFLSQITPEITTFFRDSSIPPETHIKGKSRTSLLAASATWLHRTLDRILRPGQELLIEADISISEPGKPNDRAAFELFFARKGKQYRFSLCSHGKSPFGKEYNRIDFGQNEFPWLASHEGIVFHGSKHPCGIPLRNTLSTEANTAIDMFQSMLLLLQSEDAPTVLRSVLGIKMEERHDVPDAFHFEKGGVLIGVQTTPDRNSIKRIVFREKSGRRIDLRIRRYETNPKESDCRFEFPPGSKETRATDNRETILVLGAVVNTLIVRLREQF